MKIWLKIEAILNQLLESIFAMLGSLVSRKTPKKVKDKLEQSVNKIESTKKNTQDYITDKGQKVISNTLEYKDKAIQKSGEIQHKSQEIVTKAKQINYLKVDYKKLIIAGLMIFAPFFARIKAWVISLSPKAIISSTLVATLATLSSISIYQQSKKISDKVSDGAREPAAVVDNATAISKRKEYYKLNEKRFTITHVTMPVYIESNTNLRSLSIDFTFISSNRYIKSFFDKNRHLIKDRLNSTIQPVIPAFPLEEEGKEIIKDKIQKELNSLIKELQIKGEIKEIHISSILAG